jgi:hypothetical protein
MAKSYQNHISKAVINFTANVYSNGTLGKIISQI